MSEQQDSQEHDSSEVGTQVDTLPEDLDPSAANLEYTIPNNSRRRLSGAVYVFCGIVFAAVWFVVRGGGSPFVNAGFLACGIALLALGAHHIWTGLDLLIDDKEALVRASNIVGFSVGHASAQLGWRGWLSKPTWKVLLYSDEPQPSKRALVRLDGISGSLVDMLEEDNPEDWSEFLEDESEDVVPEDEDSVDLEEQTATEADHATGSADKSEHSEHSN